MTELVRMSEAEFRSFVVSERQKIAVEIAHFDANQAQWQQENPGKWVLLKGAARRGPFFGSFDEAYVFGIGEIGHVPMLIRQLSLVACAP